MLFNQESFISPSQSWFGSDLTQVCPIPPNQRVARSLDQDMMQQKVASFLGFTILGKETILNLRKHLTNKLL